MPTESLYLGDGLYVSFDGQMIRLWAPRVEGVHGVHEVFLDVETLPRFEAFVASLRKKGKKAAQ